MDPETIQLRRYSTGSVPAPHPVRMQLGHDAVIDAPVELVEVMPTALELVEVPAPWAIDGQRILSLQRGETDKRRNVHGEYSYPETLISGTQFIIDGRRKLFWYPGTGQEHFFRLEQDSTKTINFGGDADRAKELSTWRAPRRDPTQPD